MNHFAKYTRIYVAIVALSRDENEAQQKFIKM